MSGGNWAESVPWSKVIPILAALAGAAGGAGGTDLYQSPARDARRQAWQAVNEQRNALVASYKELRLQCQAELKVGQRREDELIDHLLTCDCPP